MCTDPRRLILVPTLNEKDNVERVLRAIARCLPDADVLVVDDDSPDGTPEVVESLQAELPRVRLLVRSGRAAGLGLSVRDGYRHALDHGYDEVCIVDGDLQQDPADVPWLRRAHPDADVVIGSRYCGGAGFARGRRVSRWTSILGNAVVRLLFRLPFRDATTDFYIVTAGVLRRFRPEALRSQGYALFFELKARAWKAGFRVVEEPVRTFERRGGASHRTWRQVRLFAREVFAVWADLFLSSRAGAAGEESHVREGDLL